MLRFKSFLLPVVVALILFFYLFRACQKDDDQFNADHGSFHRIMPLNTVFEFRKGDILARPNKYLPLSLSVPGGRRYGHVAVVVEAGKGNTVEEALKKTIVVEALFYDQKTRSFLFDKEEQVRLENAWVSFGEKYNGNRYRLRINLTNSQADEIADFMMAQLNARYNIFSLKNGVGFAFSKRKPSNRSSWHCATLTWKSFEQITGIDLDGNKGLLIFPSDIIGSGHFNGPDQRVRF